jgi:hypothetical protein
MINRIFSSLKLWPSARSAQRKSSKSSYPYQAMEPRTLMCGTSFPSELTWGPSLVESQQLISPQSQPTQSQPVIGRIVNGTVTSQYPGVGMIGDNTGFFCSGTLIGSRYVLTAAHCAEGVGQTAGRFRLGSQTYSTSRVFIHPNYNPNQIGNDAAHDIAIYQLDRDVTGITPSQIFRGVPQVGQLLTLVGFGAAGNGTTGQDGSFGVKRVGTTPIDQVTPRLIKWRFDNNSESNTAPGDSGGPAFVTVNGSLFVAGITSGGDRADAAIGDNSYDTRVDAYSAWIDSIVGNVSTAPVVSISTTDAVAGETLANQPVNTANFTITRTGSLIAPLTVGLSYTGTATFGVDYQALPTSVTVPAGSASTTLTLRPMDDSLVEGTESATVRPLAGAGYQVGSNSSVTLSILDNDLATWNDQFANRINLTGSSTTITGTNTGATRETGEPNVLGLSGGKTVWWTWTAPTTGNVTISTAGSNFDTTLGVYRGSSVNQLTFVRANDDQNYWDGVYTSQVAFRAVAGVKYNIVVDGYSGAAGSIRLTIQQAANRNAVRTEPGSPAQRLSASDIRQLINEQRDRASRHPVAGSRNGSLERTGDEPHDFRSLASERRERLQSRREWAQSGRELTRMANQANRWERLQQQVAQRPQNDRLQNRLNQLDSEFSRWFAENVIDLKLRKIGLARRG